MRSIIIQIGIPLMYAIWLLPHADKYKELDHLIIELSQKYNGPRFLPHITLLADFSGTERELIIKTSELSTRLKAFLVMTDAVEIQDSYFKSLYLKIVKSKPLLDSRQHAESLFQLKPAEVFMPHVSLLYGNQSEQVKKQIIASLRDIIRHNFLINRIELISAYGPPEKWTTISTEKLH